jgi:hypothetical protein
VVTRFLGDAEGPGTLEHAARAAAEAVGTPPPEVELGDKSISTLAARLAPAQRYVRGLYAGGTLAYEAQLVLRKHGLDVASNAPFPAARARRNFTQRMPHGR